MTWTAERTALMFRLYEEYRKNPVGGWRKELAERLELRETQLIAKLGRAYRSGKLKPIGGWFGPRAPVLAKRTQLDEGNDEGPDVPIICEAPPKIEAKDVRLLATPPTNRCQFPLWPDGPKPPREPIFCGKPALPGKSWCATCYAKLFHKAKQVNLDRVMLK